MELILILLAFIGLICLLAKFLPEILKAIPATIGLIILAVIILFVVGIVWLFVG